MIIFHERNTRYSLYQAAWKLLARSTKNCRCLAKRERTSDESSWIRFKVWALRVRERIHSLLKTKKIQTPPNIFSFNNNWICRNFVRHFVEHRSYTTRTQETHNTLTCDVRRNGDSRFQVVVAKRRDFELRKHCRFNGVENFLTWIFNNFL